MLFASVEPRLSTLAVIKNCSLGLGIGGSVLTAPCRNATSTPCGRCITEKVRVWSLSVSSNSSISFEGSRETLKVLSPTVVGFQYSTTSTISPLSILGKTISSLREPSSYNEMAKLEAAMSPSLRISVLISRNVLT